MLSAKNLYGRTAVRNGITLIISPLNTIYSKLAILSWQSTFKFFYGNTDIFIMFK